MEHLIEPVNQDAFDLVENEIRTNLVAFNVTQAGPPHYEVFAFTVRDDRGVLIGGVSGSSAWQWLHVDLLWVEESHRGRGIGQQLLGAAERLGRERQCLYVDLDTFDFQARAFYEGLGYTVFGVQENYPPGHRRFYMSKSL